MKKEYFDLMNELTIDTYLSVKIGEKFVHYIIPVERKDGSKRTFGNIYDYFTKKDGFRMALGYILTETLDGYWKGQTQYFYFDKKTHPYLVEDRKLQAPLLMKMKP